MTLLEKYSKRLTVAESVYKQSNSGAELSQEKKLFVARMLENTNNFLNEQFNNSVGTQRADMGLYKKFTLNLTNVAVPNLIGPELVLTHPLSSMTGFIQYIKYTAASNKGEVAQGDVFNSPFALKQADPDYTSAKVVEEFTGDGTAVAFTLGWTPVASLAKVLVDGVEVLGSTFVPGTGVVTLAAAPALGKKVRIAYAYDNVVIPQNDIPMIKASVEAIAVAAKARRIAIYYSNIAAFQSKTEMGFDLGDKLAEQAVGRLNYEIDTEIVKTVDEIAGAALDALKWSKVVPLGISKAEHYESFAEIVAEASRIIYDRTLQFQPNFMLIASNIVPLLGFMKGWTAKSGGLKNGPYLAGTLNGLKVFVTPSLASGRFVVGLNGDDHMSSVAVFAPYMMVVPTQLLGYADGGMSQGYSTLYALEKLNDLLVVAGEITTTALPAVLVDEA